MLLRFLTRQLRLLDLSLTLCHLIHTGDQYCLWSLSHLLYSCFILLEPGKDCSSSALFLHFVSYGWLRWKSYFIFLHNLSFLLSISFHVDILMSTIFLLNFIISALHYFQKFRSYEKMIWILAISHCTKWQPLLSKAPP